MASSSKIPPPPTPAKKNPVATKSTSDPIVQNAEETRSMCDWALSVFGRINFSAKYAELCDGAKGVVLIDLPTKEMATVQGVVMSRGNAGVLIDRAHFVATDDERTATIRTDLSDPDEFNAVVESTNDRQYVVVVRLSGDDGVLDKCIRWVMVTDEVAL